MQMKTEQVILSRLLPKTGQVTSYRSRDDGELEAGWWKGRLNATNKTRFVSKTVNGDVVVVDRVTGLMWAAAATAGGCGNGALFKWTDGIDYANGLDFAGFTDWRLPNINELSSLVDYALLSPCINATFFTCNSDEYWTSTTYVGTATAAWVIDFDTGYSWYYHKTNNTRFIRCVRGGL